MTVFALFARRGSEGKRHQCVTRATRAEPRARRLCFEPLEDRSLLSMGGLLQTLTNPNPNGATGFGYSVAIDGNLAVVGEPYATVGGVASVGRAYVFDITNGALLAALSNPTPAAHDDFGCSVAVWGTTVVVGAPFDDTGAINAGAAYLFYATTGTLMRTLANPTPAYADYFGRSVAVSGSTVVVGAPNDNTGSPDAGSAYIFDAASGNLLRTLNNPAPAESNSFGNSVAVSRTTMVVGTPYGSQDPLRAGSARIYDTTMADFSFTLLNPTPAIGDNFGSSVAVAGTTLVVGAPNDDAGSSDAGSAYVYDTVTYSLLRTLNNPTPATGDNFGKSVAVFGTMAVVGAPNDDTGATNAGSAYVFDAATGSLVRTLINRSPAYNNYFGSSVAVSGSAAIVGAPGGGASNVASGPVYVFDLTAGPSVGTYTLATDTGASASDQITSDNTPQLTYAFDEVVNGTDAAVTVAGSSGTAITPIAIAGWGSSMLTLTFSAPLADGA